MPPCLSFPLPTPPPLRWNGNPLNDCSLPTPSILLGERNFGIFALAQAAVAAGHDVLRRLTQPRFGPLVKKATTQGPGRWLRHGRPSCWDRTQNPDPPTDALVRAWLPEVRVVAVHFLIAKN